MLRKNAAHGCCLPHAQLGWQAGICATIRVGDALWQEEHAQSEEDVWKRAESNHPAPLVGHPGEQIIDYVREQDTKRERNLPERHECATKLFGRDFGDEPMSRIRSRE